ncbi:MAG TPA: hypothetical protein VFO11_07790 [Candidatus Polarisedimenticolaceae bacterium]|nr:hypothetical protein [Candidatus Polarisedimenticolaceae bacterium]
MQGTKRLLALALVLLAAAAAWAARGGAAVTTSPASGPTGTVFELTGAGFPPLATGSVTFDGVDLGALSSDGNGVVRGFFMVPDVDPGRARVRVAFGKVRADSVFTVTGG